MEVEKEFYILDLRAPWQDVKKKVCTQVGNKFSWAQDTSKNHRRHLIGSSAFFLVCAAKRAQIGQLNKIIKYPMLPNVHPNFMEACRKKYSELIKNSKITHVKKGK